MSEINDLIDKIGAPGLRAKVYCKSMNKYTLLKDSKVVEKKDQSRPNNPSSVVDIDVEDQNDNNGGITEDLANSIDWVKLTKNFNIDRIKDVVKTIGRNKKDKKIIIKAIYDAMLSSGEMYKIPYGVDKLLNDLYKKNTESHNDLFGAAYNKETETLNIDILMKHAIDEYMETHTATDKDIDEIFDSPADKKVVIGDIPNPTDKSPLPEEFKTSEAEQLMQKLVKAGLLNNNWQPVHLSIAERGYLADEISNRLKIEYKWKVMGTLWNENSETLRQGKNKAVGQAKTGLFIDKLKKILDRDSIY